MNISEAGGSVRYVNVGRDCTCGYKYAIAVKTRKPETTCLESPSTINANGIAKITA
jgi:hypothetical protein